MQRRLRLVAIFVLIVAGIAGLSYYYVTRHYIARQASVRMEQLFGGRVELESADVGLSASTAHGLKLYESKEEAVKPWFSAQRVHTDASLMELVQGLLPHKLTLENVALYLRFDKDGRLLTKLPSTAEGDMVVPELIVNGASLTIEQDGRPSFAIQGVALTLREQSGKYVVAGAVNDPAWGQWGVKASAARDLTTLEATLKTAHAPVKQERLDSLPFVASAVWQQVRCEGETAANVTLNLAARESTFHFHIALEPTLTRLHVPSIDLTAEQATGKVVIEDALVRLSDVQGRVAGGGVSTSGELDFTRQPSRLLFDVRAKDVRLSKLPQSWSLPSEIDGQLTGHAKLTLAIKDGKVVPSGAGEGVVNDATVAGLPADPITLRLRPAGGRYRFSTPSETSLAPASPERQRGNPAGPRWRSGLAVH